MWVCLFVMSLELRITFTAVFPIKESEPLFARDVSRANVRPITGPELLCSDMESVCVKHRYSIFICTVYTAYILIWTVCLSNIDTVYSLYSIYSIYYDMDSVWVKNINTVYSYVLQCTVL